jgi:two-component system NarL family response regulator
MTDQVRVLVIHPGRLLRQALVQTLNAQSDIEVVAHAESADEAMRLAPDLAADLAILDADVVGEQGTSLIADLKTDGRCARVLLVADGVSPAQVERSMSAGADGFTLKAISLDEFSDTVRRVAGGEVVLHPAIASVIVESQSAFARGERQAGPVLTDRQQEIVRLLALGLPNKQIARRLDIGVETVKTHISKILAKLGVSSRTEAVLVAMREGVLGTAIGDDLPSLQQGRRRLERLAN